VTQAKPMSKLQTIDQLPRWNTSLTTKLRTFFRRNSWRKSDALDMSAHCHLRPNIYSPSPIWRLNFCHSSFCL